MKKIKRKTQSVIVIVLLVVVMLITCIAPATFADDSFTVILDVNSEEYGSAISDSNLMNLEVGDEISITAVPNPSAYVEFFQWAVFKGPDLLTIAEEGVDYTIVDNSDSHTMLTVLQSQDLKVMGVFKGNVVNNMSAPYCFRPCQMGPRNIIIVSVDDVLNAQGIAPCIQGWNNDPNDPLIAELELSDFPGGEEFLDDLVLRVDKKQGVSARLLAEGASYQFDTGTVIADENRYILVEFPDGFNWLKYDFKIVDDNDNTLKNCELTFKYPGLATIETENGAVKVGGVLYHDGEKARIGKGERTIEAVADSGYEFTGWEISGVELVDSTLNPLTFWMPFDDADVVITANFIKKDNPISGITVTPGAPVFVEGVNYVVDGNVITVTYDIPCMVGYLSDSGSYVAIKAVHVEGTENTYTFTVDNPDATEVALVVKGDPTGDGKVNMLDVGQTQAVYLRKRSFNAIQILAADVVMANGKIDSPEAARIHAAYLKKKVFDW